MQENIDEILEMIKDGKISIRQAAENTGYGRDFLKSRLIEKYGTNDEELRKIQEVLANNKTNSTTIEIDSQLLENVFLRTMAGEISLEQAREELGGISKQTLKEKFVNFIEANSHNDDYLIKYKKYKNQSEEETPQRRDYTEINFRLVAIDMIFNLKSQTKLALELNIPARTISREFEKFKNDEDDALYKAIKFYNEKTMTKQKIERWEEIIMILSLNQYISKHPELFSKTVKSKKEKQEERIQKINSESERLSKEGFTQAEISEKLGISVSSLRRIRRLVRERELLKKLPSSPGDDGEK